jgi:hypothetical protein
MWPDLYRPALTRHLFADVPVPLVVPIREARQAPLPG